MRRENAILQCASARADARTAIATLSFMLSVPGNWESREKRG
jgi:uncharacterized membrane protein YkgB